MAKKTIRITGPGIHGALITDENPTGEYPVGYEFETDSDLPAGWKGRAVVVGEEPAEGSVFVGNDDDDSDVGKARREIIEKAEGEFRRLDELHRADVLRLVQRAEKAEGELKLANEQVQALLVKLAAFDRDGDGNPGGSKPAATKEDITAAVALLDKASDDHWTAAGLPAVDAIAELTGKTVTRKAIEEAAPEAKRPTE